MKVWSQKPCSKCTINKLSSLNQLEHLESQDLNSKKIKLLEKQSSASLVDPTMISVDSQKSDWEVQYINASKATTFSHTLPQVSIKPNSKCKNNDSSVAKSLRRRHNIHKQRQKIQRLRKSMSNRSILHRLLSKRQILTTSKILTLQTKITTSKRSPTQNITMIIHYSLSLLMRQ